MVVYSFGSQNNHISVNMKISSAQKNKLFSTKQLRTCIAISEVDMLYSTEVQLILNLFKQSYQNRATRGYKTEASLLRKCFIYPWMIWLQYIHITSKNLIFNVLRHIIILTFLTFYELQLCNSAFVYLLQYKAVVACDVWDVIIFMNCNWVITRWQWLFYM